MLCIDVLMRCIDVDATYKRHVSAGNVAGSDAMLSGSMFATHPAVF